MNAELNFLIITLINSLILIIAMTNIILYPVKIYYKIIAYIYLASCQLLLYMKIGQILIFIAIVGTILIIAFSNKHFISTVVFSLLGYLTTVLINYTILSAANIIGLTVTDINTGYHSFLILCVYGVTTTILTYIVGKYLKNKLLLIKNIFTLKIKLLVLFELISCFIVFTINIVQGEYGGYPSSIIYFNVILFGLFFIITLIIFFFCLQIMQKNHELMQLQKEREDLSEYMTKLEDQYQNMRIFKHDYLNILSTLKCYIMETNSEDLKNYFQDKVLQDSERLEIKDLAIGRLSNIKVLEMKGVLYSKLLTAMNLDLKIHVEIRDEISSISMEMIDLSRILGIFMDNAIEAASNSLEKQLTIVLVNSPDCIAIIIANSASEEHIDLDQIYQRDVSSKEGHSGIGLSEVRKLLSRYTNTVHSTNYTDHTFTQTLEICKTNI